MSVPADVRFRPAHLGDVPELSALIALSARVLQSEAYTAKQLDGAIGTIFGVDTQLIRDGTYFVAETAGRIVGCGGWSRRAATCGGDGAKRGDDRLRDPAADPAMIRAFFVHPDFARRGIGRELLRRSEVAAWAAGFRDIEIMATLAGVPLYVAGGYTAVEHVVIDLVNGATLPVVRMRRTT